VGTGTAVTAPRAPSGDEVVRDVNDTAAGGRPKRVEVPAIETPAVSTPNVTAAPDSQAPSVPTPPAVSVQQSAPDAGAAAGTLAGVRGVDASVDTPAADVAVTSG
jgi:hypothetical protein